MEGLEAKVQGLKPLRFRQGAYMDRTESHQPIHGHNVIVGTRAGTVNNYFNGNDATAEGIPLEMIDY